MCGIAGIFNRNFHPVNFQILKEMTDVQRHRGPDDQGFTGFSFKKDKIFPVNPEAGKSLNTSFHGGIGFNRLSILDLSMNGHQPMISQDKKVVLAYNGETYNAFEFTSQLERNGYNFRSKSDTEVLLNLYMEYGIEKMLDIVNGMFAFCIVDLSNKKLFLARDHVGIKPMYWCKMNETILFASEMKAFLYYPDFKAEIDENNFDEYLYYKYCAHDRTMLKNVFQIPPGHYMEISTEGEKLIKYWEPNLNPRNKLTKNEAVEELGHVLKSCVKSQLISDVKVGCQLSGGIDSSMITTFARQYFDADMDTFSVIFKNERVNEEKYIDQVIKLTKPIPHKFLMTPDYFFKNVVLATWHIDVPIPIAQALGIKRLAYGASEHVTVLLSGEGADELMGGYRQFHEFAFKMRYPLLLSIFSKLPKKGRKVKIQFSPNMLNRDYFFRHRSSVHIDEFREFRPETDFEKIFNQRQELFRGNDDLLKTSRLYDMKGWLSHTLNIQDKMTMSHSLENRVPFLDKNIIDFVFSLPSEFFVRANKNPLKMNSASRNTKITLKKLAASYYGDDFVYRKKVGFLQPLQEYFSHQGMVEFVNDTILPGIKKRGIINYENLEKIWLGMHNRNFKGRSIFWNCFTFELWAQIFIDQSLKP